MDKVNLNLLNSLQYKKIEDKKEEEKASAKQEPLNVEKEAKTKQDTKISSEEMLNSMEMIARQNKANMVVNIVDPTKYLSKERMNEIESNMLGFTGKVEIFKDALTSEFGKIFSELPEDQQMALAAKAAVTA